MRKKTRKRKSGKGKIIRNYREFIEKDGADFSPKTTTIPHSKSKGKASQVKPREAQEGTDAEAADRTNQGKGAIRCRLPSQRKDTSW